MLPALPYGVHVEEITLKCPEEQLDATLDALGVRPEAKFVGAFAPRRVTVTRGALVIHIELM